MKPILVYILVLFSTFLNAVPAYSQEQSAEVINQTIEGRVVRIMDEKNLRDQIYQKLEIEVTRGIIAGKKIVVENGNMQTAENLRYEIGDELVLMRVINADGVENIYIADYVRRKSLIWLFLLFIVVTVLVGRFYGLMSILGMALSFIVIFKFVLPLISAGYNPLFVAVVGACAIVPATFLLSHGVNKKTVVAIVGTLISLTLTGLLAYIFVSMAKLTGFASEEATFIQAYRPGAINMKGLLMAGIIIGGLGVFDDVAVSQAGIVEELKKANSKLQAKELYFRAMRIGRDHIASVVNTLVLVYAGAAMPLLLLFIDNPRPFTEIVNYEFIADEIVRTLVASIGLILAVPVTTIIAAYIFSKKLRINKIN